MPTKQGRPVSTDTTDPSVLRKRLLNANRVRRHRENKRATAALAVSQTPAQLNQVEAIAPRPFSDNQALDTVAALGLRIDNLDLIQDPGREALRQEAEPIDEQDMLYGIEENPTISTPSVTVPTALIPTPRLLEPQSPHRIDIQTLPILTPTRPPPSLAQPDTNTPCDQESFEDNHPFPPQTPSRNSPTQSVPDENVLYREPSPSCLTSPVVDSVQLDTEESDVEASVYTFASARSLQEEAEEDEEGEEEVEDQISPHTYTVLKLFEQIQSGFHGCSQEKHDADLYQHMSTVNSTHRGLSSASRTSRLPKVLDLPELLSPQDISNMELPSPAQWQYVFCGTPQQQEGRSRPKQICLHAEETQAVEGLIAFDVDSLLGFGSSLQLARKGLLFQPAPNSRQNMKTDVHITMQVPRQTQEVDADGNQQQRSHAALLRDIPHLQIGRLVGAEEISLYIIFPHLDQHQKRFESLTQSQLERFFDKVFHPAVHKNLEAHQTQHLTSAYRHAVANSQARQVEARMMETASYQSKQNLAYTLQPDCLDDIWIEMLDIIERDPGLKDFEELTIFFAAKNLKLRFKGTALRPTMSNVMDDFELFLNDAVNMDFVYQERFYVDLGKETCPRVGATSSQSLRYGDEAQVYSWKRCCLEHNLDWMYDGKPPAKHGPGQQYYTQNLLRDACNLTSIAPKTSKLYRGGLIYSQFYGSIKELSDAANQFPFQNDGLEELAMDPSILKGVKTVAGGSRRSLHIIERAYVASKSRAQIALRASRKKSFGLREEHRVSWLLFQSLKRYIDSQTTEGPLQLLDDCPSYAWPVRTVVYLKYLEQNANKFAAGFEIIHAQCAKDLVTWEETKMMAMFLRCLRFVFVAHQLQREPALWESRQDRVRGNPPQRQHWYGLGFRNTLSLYGYAWLEPRFDWVHLQFQPRITDNVMFGNHMLAGQYKRHATHVRSFLNLSQHIDASLLWMRQHYRNGVIRRKLNRWMVHTCLKQFRIDVLSSLLKEIIPERKDEVQQGMITFCHESLSEIMDRGLYLISGNRCAVKRPEQLYHILFDFDDQINRTHWNDKPFRVLYQRAMGGLQAVGNQNTRLDRDFKAALQASLFKYHWILPYPSANGLTQISKGGQRMWYSIESRFPDEHTTSIIGSRQRNAGMVPNGNNQPVREWRWAGKSWQAGQPETMPAVLGWNKEQWSGWITRNAGRQESTEQTNEQQ